MVPVSEVTKALAEDKIKRIIELYLSEKFKGRFDPVWLNNMGNYANLTTAINFFHKLGHDGLNLDAIGSSNQETRRDYAGQFKTLEGLLDKLVVLTGDNPPIATSFNEKGAILEGLVLSQQLGSRSLRDLHAQSSNLGIAEKLLGNKLGPSEWLGEVDIERLLIKLGVKDRTHITRLTEKDIGMILHFERVKHADETAPYSIPLIINKGSTGSLRSQGSHWTYAMVNVDPTSNSVTINYQDSMPLSGDEQNILRNAINYTDGHYSAFPAATTKTVNVNSDNLQRDGWSCGYRALKGLLTAPGFPNGGVIANANWTRFTGTPTRSEDLRDATYDLLLSDLVIDRDYFEAMKIKPDMVKLSEGKKYELSDDYMKDYMGLLKGGNKTKSVITSNNFKEDYNRVIKAWTAAEPKTARTESLENLGKNIRAVINDNDLSSDAKILALVDAFAAEYAAILKTLGGSNSGLGKFIKKFCEEQFGIELDNEQRYHLKKDGLLMRMLNDRLGVSTKKSEETLLPPVRKTRVESTKTSQSTPVVGSKKIVQLTVSPSVNSIGKEATDRVDLTNLRSQKELTRVGTMFGARQFCFAEKSSGVEPGFRAVDLNEAFFTELEKILSEEKLDEALFNKKMSGEERRNLTQLREGLKIEGLERKQQIFSTFVNAYVKGSHREKELDNRIKWLCKEVKNGIEKNEKLSSWLYKLDYAEGQKDRMKANKEAMREYVGTRLARIFSPHNQRQNLVWVRGDKGLHSMLACGWQNGLHVLKEFLHEGGEPDYNGILVEDKDALVKRAKVIPGLGKNLIFGIAVGDRDGMGKEAQNKGFANGQFYGFDYGKPYEGSGVSSSLQDDFSFEDKYAKAPAIFRGSSFLGQARHGMYRNYSVFYDTTLSDRMIGVHLLRKMITGENPSEELIKSYPPELREGLHNIQKNTPSPDDLLGRLSRIRETYQEGGVKEALIDTYIMQISTGKLQPFDLYFTEVKIDLINDAIKHGMPNDELNQYIAFIDDMAATAAKSNANILRVFAQRALLHKSEIDLLDKLEKIFSPTSVMSHDGKAFLNTMRFDPPTGRIPFQLQKNEDGTYTLMTTNKTVAPGLRKLGLDVVSNEKGLSCKLSEGQLQKLMVTAESVYNQKRESLLVKPTYQYETFPYIVSLFNQDKRPEARAELGFAWRSNDVLALRIVAKTEEQVKLATALFGVTPAINKEQIIVIPPEDHKKFQMAIAQAYQREQAPKVSIEKEIVSSKDTVREKVSGKWEAIHKKAEELPEVTTDSLVEQEAMALITRLNLLVEDREAMKKLGDAIKEMTSPDIKKLMEYSDETLRSSDTIQCILEERIADIKPVVAEVVVTSTMGEDQVLDQRATL
ncbi:MULTISPECIES: hypothetical protein [unclassified Legionella]|uniref:hypothetical protein n=1 Tax=unclassified Legionella TaxID=2622702 RepID=UPI00105593A4|nr:MULTISPECIES: hypothetical protein [unclassified Legionella]MDI9818039.1 hypothetical protein [Legionella sp. PL877]